MSLIQGIITDDFITVGTDDKKNLVKIGKQMMIACTGSEADNAKLLDGFVTYQDEKGYVAVNDTENVSYVELMAVLSERFAIMQADQSASFQLNSFVCGYNGEEMEITIFALGMDEIPDGMVKAHKPSKMPYQAVTLGKTVYSQYLHTLIHTNYHDEKELNALRYKYMMQDVFAEAAKVDKAVNADVFVEKIRRKDMM